MVRVKTRLAVAPVAVKSAVFSSEVFAGLVLRWSGRYAGWKVASYPCQRAGACRERDCRPEPHSPRTWSAPGGAARWFLGTGLAPHSWGQRSRSSNNNKNEDQTAAVPKMSMMSSGLGDYKQMYKNGRNTNWLCGA